MQGSKEKPFSGLLQSKQGEKQTGQGIDKPVVDQGEKNSEALYLIENAEAKSLAEQPTTPTVTQSQVEDAVVTASNAKLKESNSSANRSITVTGENVILNRQPTKPFSRIYKAASIQIIPQFPQRALNRSSSIDQEQDKSELKGGKLNLLETTGIPARNICLTKLSKPKAVLNSSRSRLSESKTTQMPGWQVEAACKCCIC